MYITKNPFGELCEDCRVKQNLGRQGRLNKLDKEKSKYHDKIKKQVLHMQNFSCTLKFKVGKKIHHKITSKEAGSVHKKFILVGLTSPPYPFLTSSYMRHAVNKVRNWLSYRLYF